MTYDAHFEHLSDQDYVPQQTRDAAAVSGAYPLRIGPCTKRRAIIAAVRRALKRGSAFLMGPHFIVQPVGDSMRVWRDGEEIVCYEPADLVELWNVYPGTQRRPRRGARRHKR